MLKRIPRLLAVVVLVGFIVSCGGPEQKKMKFYNKGKAFYEKEDFVRAKLEFKNAIQIDPKFAEAHLELAYVQLNPLADYAEAVRHLDFAIQAGFKKAEALVNRGLTRFEQWRRDGETPEPPGLLALARQDLQLALRIDPTLIQAYINLALVQMEASPASAGGMASNVARASAYPRSWPITIGAFTLPVRTSSLKARPAFSLSPWPSQQIRAGSPWKAIFSFAICIQRIMPLL